MDLAESLFLIFSLSLSLSPSLRRSFCQRADVLTVSLPIVVSNGRQPFPADN